MTLRTSLAANSGLDESNQPLSGPRPTVAICAALVRARWGAWDRPAYLLAQEYVAAVQRAGALALMVPPDQSAERHPDEVLDLVDGLMLAGGSDIDPSAYGHETHPETKATVPERDQAELDLQGGVSPPVLMGGERHTRRDQDDEGDERTDAEAADRGEQAGAIGAEYRDHDRRQHELTADEERHPQ